ncbi:MAG: hypothetical protein ACRD0U_08650, partial [Acidimicrobiales bacterium]
MPIVSRHGHRSGTPAPTIGHTTGLGGSLFPTSGPVPPDRLIGREDYVLALTESLRQGEHRIVTATGKVGKTSVARAAVTALESEGWGSATVDLLRANDLATAIERLVGTSLVAGADDAVPETSSTFGEAFAHLERYAEAADRRVVVFVDGFHELVTTQLYGRGDEVTKEMRASLDQTTRLACLFVGAVPYVMRDLFTSKSSALFQFGTVAALAPVQRSDWDTALRSRFNDGGCEIEDAALDRLLELSQGHTRTTMLIARWCWEIARASERHRVEEPIVDRAFRAAQNGEAPVLEGELVRVRTSGKHAIGIALRVARGESPYKSLPPAIARQTLRGLETLGVVDHPRSGAWQIVDPLFREYLLRPVDEEPAVTEEWALAALLVAEPEAAPATALAAKPMERVEGEAVAEEAVAEEPV